MIVLLIILIILILWKIRISSPFNESMKKDIYETAYDLGVNYLKLIKKMNNVSKPTVMFDIDGTLLYVNKDYSLTPIKPIIKLLHWCIKNGFIVLIITAREIKYLQQTKNDLSKNGITYDYLYLRISPQDDYQTFKADIKKMYLEKYGLTTVMSIGDNDLDINGDYSGYSIKLPNETDPRLFHVNMYGQLENVIP